MTLLYYPMMQWAVRYISCLSLTRTLDQRTWMNETKYINKFGDGYQVGSWYVCCIRNIQQTWIQF